MKNKDIIKLLSSTISFMELHGENEFKIKSYSNAVYNLERQSKKLNDLNLEQIAGLPGVGKSIANTIDEIKRNEQSEKLTELIKATPPGLVKLLKLRGIGAKKLRVLWQQAHITNANELLQAIDQGKLSQLKGFGAKTIQNLRGIALFALEVEGYVYYADAYKWAQQLIAEIVKKLPKAKLSTAGKLRRKWEIINKLEFVLAYPAPMQVAVALEKIEALEKSPTTSGIFTWRGYLKHNGLAVEIHLTSLPKFFNTLFLKTGAQQHIHFSKAGQTLKQIAEQEPSTSEEAIYNKLGLAYCPPELREGSWELPLAEAHSLPKLVETNDLQGVLHNHSTYSDGENSLEEMAKACINAGYSYLGISDHSKAANFYANGMFEETVKKQHQEIDRLNQQLTPFKIFKGIEADILANGALDYNAETLASFDFVVASIHSGLQMNKEKATNRLLAAIANPYTTMLGHATGRLLLLRQGYPIDHKTIIDACAHYGVIIEINAHPKRLDLDWRWVHYALEQNVLFSINPDAHATDGINDMYYGVCTGRKGGLTADRTFNAWPLSKVENYFSERKNKNGAT